MTWLIVFCSLVFVLGLIAGTRLGMWLEERAAARDLAEERAEVEADEYVGQLVDPPEVSHEWEPVHVRQALALTRGDPVPYAFPPWSLLNADPPGFDEEIQAMIANANANPSVRWLDQLEGTS